MTNTPTIEQDEDRCAYCLHDRAAHTTREDGPRPDCAMCDCPTFQAAHVVTLSDGTEWDFQPEQGECCWLQNPHGKGGTMRYVTLAAFSQHIRTMDDWRAFARAIDTYYHQPLAGATP